MQLATTMALVFSILNANGSRLNEQFKTSLDEKKIKIVNTVDIHRAEITDVGSTYDLIDNTTERIRGKSDFNKNVLSPDTVKIYTSIRLGYDISQNASGKEAELKYGSTFSSSFRNARLKITQGGVLLNIPFSELINPYSGNNRSDDYVDLDLPVVLVGNDEFKVQIEFPVGASAHGTMKDYLEVAFKGVETTRSLAA